MWSILLVVLLICVGGSFSVDVARCSTVNDTASTLTFEQYSDVAGRYLAKLCTDPVPGAQSWKLTLMLHNSERPCKRDPFKGIHMPGKIHSVYENSVKIDVNCSQICLNTTFDLIFSGCYSIGSSFSVDPIHSRLRHINYTYFNIKNNFTKENFTHNMALYDVLEHDKENVTVIWHTGVPFVDYEVTACKIINETGEEDIPSCVTWPASACAAPSATVASCRVRFGTGCYSLHLKLFATWMHGFLRDQADAILPYPYCKPSSHGVPSASGSSPAWIWGACAALAVCAVCAAARVLWRSREVRAAHKLVLREWLEHRNESSPVPAPVPPARKHVLLLYAREGPHAAHVTDALRAMLQQAPDTQVYDLFTAEAMSMAAAAPGAWVRGMLQRADVRVLLLQTPALAALYRDQLLLAAHGTQMVEPLLGRRVAYAAPQFGDSLLQYAVRLTAEAAHAHSNYHKYYVATLSELPTEMFPQLVPYRRYLLPGAAALLARDVCDVTPADAALARLAAAVRTFVDHATDSPDYLMDELIFI